MLAIICLSIALLGCEDAKLMIINNSTEVLENPYPMKYPSTKPLPNKVIGVLHRADKVKILSQEFGKDYLVYKIRLTDGSIGYVIYTDNAFQVVGADQKSQ